MVCVPVDGTFSWYVYLFMVSYRSLSFARFFFLFLFLVQDNSRRELLASDEIGFRPNNRFLLIAFQFRALHTRLCLRNKPTPSWFVPEFPRFAWRDSVLGASCKMQEWPPFATDMHACMHPSCFCVSCFCLLDR